MPAIFHSGNATTRQGWGFLTVVLVVYLLLYLVAWLIALPHPSDGVPILPWNIAPAVSFALVARLGWRWAPVTFAAPLLAEAVGGSLWGGPDAILLTKAIAEGVACLLAGLMLRFFRTEGDFERPRTVFVLFVTAFLFAAVVGAALGVGAFRSGIDVWKSFDISYRVFLSHLVALLAVAPLLIGLRLPGHWPEGRSFLSSAESLLQATALAVIAWEVFGRFANQELHFFYLLFLPFTWIAIRHGQTGSVMALATIYLAPILSDRLLGHQDHAIVELQIRLVVLAVTSLLLGVLVSERRLSGERMLARQAEIRHFQRLNVGWEMASALAHELNQPLTSAMNYTQAALRMISAPSPNLEAASRAMEKSVDQIERVGQTIHGLRDFMRKGELRLGANNIGDMADDAIRLVQAEANAAGVTLRLSGFSTLPPVMADKIQIVQVLVNLIRNAVQALTATGTKNAGVIVLGRVVEQRIEVSVQDNGPGLSPEVKARLFEPFVTTKEAGMGLGLSISKSILEAHEGRLWAENSPYGGTIFRFTLPVAAGGNADA
ncbi:MAG: ATP-binding protein [Alphaproteobacteria bacterium]